MQNTKVPYRRPSPMPPKVIVVDDEAASATVVAKLLERLGCDVTVCGQATSAVELALSGQVDIVSLDLSMPELDGYQVLALIRSYEHSRRLPSVPVVTVTGHVTPTDQAEALAGGFAAHLRKPLMVDALRQALARALTLRSELHRTRYTEDHQALERSTRNILDGAPGGSVATAAGLALALTHQGSAALRDALLLAYQGHGDEARQPLAEFSRMVRPLGVQALCQCLDDMARHLDPAGEVLDTAAVLARAELDRVVFTLREQILS